MKKSNNDFGMFSYADLPNVMSPKSFAHLEVVALNVMFSDIPKSFAHSEVVALNVMFPDIPKSFAHSKFVAEEKYDL